MTKHNLNRGKLLVRNSKPRKYCDRNFKIGKMTLSNQYSYFNPNLETSQYFFAMISIELELSVTKQKMTGKIEKNKKKHALGQRVLYKISHLTISSLVVISDKRRGQVNLYYQLETIHLNSENLSLIR